jgi:glutamate carboxypeptidase
MAQACASKRGAMVEELRSVVAIPSKTGHSDAIEECRDAFVSRLAALGASVERVPGAEAPGWLREGVAGDGRVPDVVICRRTRAGARASVLLCGHVDTVHEPSGGFRELTVSGDARTATGPGCADMKGGILVAIAALEALEACGEGASWTFVLNADEETGSFHSDAILRREAANGHDFGLIFEPALPDGGLVVERPASGQFMIECTGRAAHVGRDFASGISAVGALAEAIERALAFADPSRSMLVNIGPLEGGSATNIIPDKARAWGNVRCSGGASESLLCEALRSLNANTRLPSTRVELVFNRPGKPMTAQVEALAGHARGVAEDLGQRLPFGRTGGVCDGNNLQAGGLATIDTLGVRGGGLHTKDEWIELDSLVERAQLAAVLMMRLSR